MSNYIIIICLNEVITIMYYIIQYVINDVILHHTIGLEGGIRPVILPVDTAGRFQNLASSNTRKDIETCGILSGKLVCLSLFILPQH